MERRRKRRKESNRESARRSRLRKQQHLDDLTSQVYVKQLKDQNKQLSMALSITSQNLVAVQAQNSVLQTQKMELDSRLGALTEILCYMNTITSTGASASTNPAMVNNITSSNSYDLLGASCTWNQQPIDLYQCF
ncbi:unnamed protein product [Urochloa decumbens]|uniref:BZIP domain-containing protein n=1 Tax=Urochloa decumbens TaxID=240449 RepID=A0ABC9FGC8_9POAL